MTSPPEASCARRGGGRCAASARRGLASAAAGWRSGALLGRGSLAPASGLPLACPLPPFDLGPISWPPRARGPPTRRLARERRQERIGRARSSGELANVIFQRGD